MEPAKKRVWTVYAVASLACCVALTALWSWIAGVADLFAPSNYPLPMAPGTALVMVLAGGSVLLLVRRSGHGAICRCVRMSAGVIALVGISAMVRSWMGWSSPLEEWLAGTSAKIGSVRLGQMSPLTGAAFLGSAILLWLRASPSGSGRGARWGAAGLAMALYATGLGVIASYVSGRPWLASSGTIPMALWTALAFVFLSVALGSMRPVAAPVACATPPCPAQGARRSNAVAVTVAVLLGMVVGLAGAIRLRQDLDKGRATARETLQTIGDLKAAQIAQWRRDRLDEVRAFGRAEFVSGAVGACAAEAGDSPARQELLHWLTLLKAGDRYESVTLYDALLRPQLTVPRSTTPHPAPSSELADRARRSEDVVASDLERDDGGRLHMDVLLPVFGPTGSGARAVVGFVNLCIDPSGFLFPLLRTWPTSSESAETLLVRREGNEVVFLNDPRHSSHAALVRRVPVALGTTSPAAMAVMGREGHVEGVDYRGVPVLAAIRAVPGSPWFIEAKQDCDEVYAPLRRTAGEMWSLTVLLALATGLGVSVIRKRREVASAERMLAEERERLVLAQRVEHLMNSANDAIILSNARWRIIEANERAAQFYGYSADEMKRLDVVLLRAPAARESFERDMAQVDERGEACFETLHMRKDGGIFPVEISVKAVELGGLKHYLSIIRDITRRKRQEREIERLTRLYATLSQINQSIVRIRSREELFREICRVTAEYSGFRVVWLGWLDPDTHEVRVVGRSGEDQGYLDHVKVYADDRPEGRGPVGTCIREGRRCVVNDVLNDPQMAPWHAAAQAYGLRAVAALPIRFGGSVCGAFAVYSDEPHVFREREVDLLEETALDISFALDHLDQEIRHARAEAALRESEAHYRSLFEHMMSGYAHCRVIFEDGHPADYEYLAVNAAFEKVTGLKDVVGRRVSEVIPGYCRDNPESLQVFGGVAQTGIPARWEHYLKALKAWFSFSVYCPAQGEFVVISENITEQRRAEQEKRALEAQLLQAQKLEAIGTLAGGVAHEINNPIMAIMGYADLIAEKSDDGEVGRFAGVIKRETERVAAIVRNLLRFARQDQVESRSPARLCDITEATLSLIGAALRHDQITLKVEVPADLPEVSCINQQIQQVVLNLLTNARDAVNAKYARHHPDKVVAVSAEKLGKGNGTWVRLTVTDHGVGIPDDVRDRIFEPFFTTKPKDKGTGLGLSISHSIVRDHGGELLVETAVGEWTRFHVDLPLNL